MSLINCRAIISGQENFFNSLSADPDKCLDSWLCSGNNKSQKLKGCSVCQRILLYFDVESGSDSCSRKSLSLVFSKKKKTGKVLVKEQTILPYISIPNSI